MASSTAAPTGWRTTCIALGVGPDTRVAIVPGAQPRAGGRACSAILKAGGAYVPLDPALSGRTAGLHAGGQRADGVADPSGAAATACRRRPCRRSCSMTGDGSRAGAASRPRPRSRTLGLTPHHLAYVIYTSGSTGTPKGVVMRARTSWPTCCNGNAVEGLDSRPACCSLPPLGFRRSRLERSCSTLARGGTLVLITRRTAPGSGGTRGAASRRNASSGRALPCIDAAGRCRSRAARTAVLPALRTVIAAGERLRLDPRDRRWLRASPQRRLHQPLRPDRDDMRHRMRSRRPRRRWPHCRRSAARSPTRSLHPGRRGEPVPIGVAGRALHRRRGRGARLPEPARADRRALRRRSRSHEPGAACTAPATWAAGCPTATSSSSAASTSR